MKKILSLLIIFGSIHAKDIVYFKQDIHAFLPPNKELSLYAGMQLMNGTIDFFDFKNPFGNGTCFVHYDRVYLGHCI